MNILVMTSSSLFPSEGRPGAGLFFANLVRRVRRLVEQVVVISPIGLLPWPLDRLARFRQRRLMPAHQWWHGVEVFRPQYLSLSAKRRLWFQGRTYCLSVRLLCEALHRRHRFDVVVGYGFSMGAYAASVMARAFGRPCVSWAIGSDVNTAPRLSVENARLLTHNVRYTDVILTESDALRREIIRRCPQARHVHTYYKGIELAALKHSADKAAVRARLGLSAERTYLISCGAAAKAKGTDEFFQAFAMLAGEYPALSAIWIGGGQELASLKARAAQAGLADRFAATGQVSRATVLEHMRAADLMAFASHAEGLPNVVMESLAAGLPTVATDVGGIGEVLADGLTGLLVPAKDPAALANGIRRMLQDRRWASQLARRGHGLMLSHFDVDLNAAVAVQILRHVAEGGPADAALPACANIEPGRLPIDALSDPDGGARSAATGAGSDV